MSRPRLLRTLTVTPVAVGISLGSLTQAYTGQGLGPVATTTVPDVARRLAQELIVNDKVNILGIGITPVAMAGARRDAALAAGGFRG